MNASEVKSTRRYFDAYICNTINSTTKPGLRNTYKKIFIFAPSSRFSVHWTYYSIISEQKMKELTDPVVLINYCGYAIRVQSGFSREDMQVSENDARGRSFFTLDEVMTLTAAYGRGLFCLTQSKITVCLRVI